METKILNENGINEAARLIASGELVAVPTETVYGLACNGLDEKAVETVYETKGRPEVKPLALMLHKGASVTRYCTSVPRQARVLMQKFWPGPLTIVLNSKDIVPDIVRAGGKTVALRCPDHPLTQAILKKARLPFAAPSANPSGEKSPVKAEEVLKYFNGRIEGIIDGGECTLGKESTIIDLSKTPFTVLREGAVSTDSVFMALMATLTIIGITGGTGSGKTTALRAIVDMGGLVIDTDEVYHSLLNDSEPMLEALNCRFPGAIPEGTRDTKALGQIVFSDPDGLRDLNTITHKYVSEKLQRLLTDWSRQGKTLAAIDAIALIEGGAAAICKATVGITAPPERRIERLMKREGISRDYAELRISAQKPDDYFEKNCDFTVCNDGTEEDFYIKCKSLFDDIIRR